MDLILTIFVNLLEFKILFGKNSLFTMIIIGLNFVKDFVKQYYYRKFSKILV